MISNTYMEKIQGEWYACFTSSAYHHLPPFLESLSLKHSPFQCSGTLFFIQRKRETEGVGDRCHSSWYSSRTIPGHKLGHTHGKVDTLSNEHSLQSTAFLMDWIQQGLLSLASWKPLVEIRTVSTWCMFSVKVASGIFLFLSLQGKKNQQKQDKSQNNWTVADSVLIVI